MKYLKCDNEPCTHVEYVDDITRDQVGMPCPLCGASLLTQRDYNLWKWLVCPIVFITDFLGLTRDYKPGDEGTVVSVRSHEGKVLVAEKDVKSS